MKRLLSILISATFLFFGSVVRAQDSGTDYQFTLEQCLEFAFKNNYNRQSLQLSEDAKVDSYKQSKMERLPSLNGSLSEKYSNNDSKPNDWNGSYSLNASMTVFQGGAINNTIEQNKLQVEQAGMQVDQYDNNLTINILQAFLSVLGNEELLKLQESLLQSSEEQLKQGKVKYDAGSILESDYLLLEAQYASDQNNILDSKISRDNSLYTLKSLLSMDPRANLSIVYPDTAVITEVSALPAQDVVLEKVIATWPSLKISQSNVEIAHVGVKIARSSYLPPVTLSAAVGSGHLSNFTDFGTQLNKQFNQQVGVAVSIPIFNNNRTKSKVTQSQIQLQQAELDRKQTEIDVRQTAVQEYYNVLSSYHKYQATDIKQQAYLKTFQAYNEKFKVGAITAVDLLQQQNNYISAMNEYIQHKYSFMLNRKILDVYMGESIKM